MALNCAVATDRLYPQVTIDALPDNVLLETFELYLGKDLPEYITGHNYDGWQTLVHVCRRWRCIVFASPRRLDLKLYCTRQRLVKSETLNIWPELPIVIHANDIKSKDNVTNIIAGLGQHTDRVCKIYLAGHFQDSLLKEVAKIDKPFPALTSLRLFSWRQNVPVLPDSFLGGSAPRLRSLDLAGIPYPSIGKLLSSTTNLVELSLWGIPHSGYISPETIVPILSTLSRLESLQLGLKHPRSRTQRASRHPPPITRTVFSNLTFLNLSGDIEYLEDILSQIETPMLNRSSFRIFNQLVFDTPLLGHFILRTETFMRIHTACLEFHSWGVRIRLSEQGVHGTDPMMLNILCKPLDWQLSAVAQVLNSLSTLECLKIAVPHEDLQGEIEVTQWQELLHPFTSVTLMDENSARLIAPALHYLAERETEGLPALQHLRLATEDWQPSGPVKEAIEKFIITQRLHGHSVTVYYWDAKSGEYVLEGR
jgi:hypothetical protein